MTLRYRIFAVSLGGAVVLALLMGVMTYWLLCGAVTRMAQGDFANAHQQLFNAVKALADEAVMAYLDAAAAQGHAPGDGLSPAPAAAKGPQENSSAAKEQARTIEKQRVGRTRYVAIRDLVLSTTYGKTGYAFVLDKSGAPVFHPEVLKGGLTGRKDSGDEPYYKEIRRAKNGARVVAWRESAQSPPRDCLLLYNTIADAGWIVVSACFLDEADAPTGLLRGRIALAAFLIALLAIPVAMGAASFLVEPVADFIRRLEGAASADPPSDIEVSGPDEIGMMARRVNRFIERLRETTDVLRRRTAEQRREEEAVARQREFLRQVIDTDPSFVFAKDAQGRYTLVNKAVADAYGLRVEDIIGKTDAQLAALAPKVKRGRPDERLVIETGEERFIPEESLADASGAVRWLQTILRPIENERDDARDAGQVLGVATDITKRKQAEQALREAHNKLERRVEERTAELQAANSDLQREVGERARVEKKLQKANLSLSSSVKEIEQRAHEITLINRMGDLLQACQSIEETYSVVQEIGGQLFPDESGALCVVSAKQNLLEAVASWGPSQLNEGVFAPGDCWALRRGKTHAAPAAAPAGTAHTCRHLSAAPPNGYLCAPMIAQGEVLGLLHVQWGDQDQDQPETVRASRAESKQRLAMTVAEQLALSLANLKLRQTLRAQSIRDPLTGLFNRRYMEESIEREARRAERRQKPMGVIMLDVDHFKSFNDQFGHDAGDNLLRELGRLLQDNVRKEDIACRYGGEEFTLILPESSLPNTQRRAEQLRVLVRAQLAPDKNPKISRSVTISLGVAIFPDHGQTAAAAIHAADQALYQAKTQGRDRVAVWAETSPG